MKVNWKVRLQNKTFLLSALAVVVLVAIQVCRVYGISFDAGVLKTDIISAVEVVSVALVALGITTDPTTPGAGDSARALSYTEPGVAPEDDCAPDDALQAPEPESDGVYEQVLAALRDSAVVQAGTDQAEDLTGEALAGFDAFDTIDLFPEPGRAEEVI